MVRKIFAAICVLLAIAAGGTGIYLALNNMEADPVLLEAPEAAKAQAVSLMDALCAGDYASVSAVLHGQPELGMDRQSTSPVGALFQEAYEQSLAYELIRECYATDTGVALDFRVTALDINSLMVALRQRSQQLLEQKIAEAEDVSAVYDENGEYREDVVMLLLYDAAEQLLAERSTRVVTELTLECVYENGQWWIVPGDTLLEIIGLGIAQ